MPRLRLPGRPTVHRPPCRVQTYARELGTAVTALGDSASLLDVQQAELTTGGLNNPRPVGAGVVAKASPTVSRMSRRQGIEIFGRELTPFAKAGRVGLTGCGDGRRLVGPSLRLMLGDCDEGSRQERGISRFG